MIALIQRVTHAQVRVGERILGTIAHGIAALVGIRRADDTGDAERLIERVLGYRIFPDAAGRMNLCLSEVGGGLLLVPQFTLAADTARGMRPGFSTAAAAGAGAGAVRAPPGARRARHDRSRAANSGRTCTCRWINDGPVTFWLET